MTPELMQAEIESATAVLVGAPLFQCTRAVDMAAFGFGKRQAAKDQRQGTREVGEYALHVQCAWRISRGDKVVVGKHDLYYPADETQERTPDFEWDVQGANRQDRLLGMLFDHDARQFAVQRVEVGSAASLRILLDDGLCLEVFPDRSTTSEYWRLFRPSTNDPHFVVTGSGIEKKSGSRPSRPSEGLPSP